MCEIYTAVVQLSNLKKLLRVLNRTLIQNTATDLFKFELNVVSKNLSTTFTYSKKILQYKRLARAVAYLVYFICAFGSFNLVLFIF